MLSSKSSYKIYIHLSRTINSFPHQQNLMFHSSIKISFKLHLHFVAENLIEIEKL
jgi:transcriptional regulatory protein LevR